jgi:hypothetical protein
MAISRMPTLPPLLQWNMIKMKLFETEQWSTHQNTRLSLPNANNILNYPGKQEKKEGEEREERERKNNKSVAMFCTVLRKGKRRQNEKKVAFAFAFACFSQWGKEFQSKKVTHHSITLANFRMETDSRVEFVLGYVDKDFGNRGCPDHILHGLRHRREIPEFLDDASVSVLLFILKDGGNEVEATTDIQPSVDFEAYMFFYKAAPCAIPHKREEMGKILKMTRGETAVRYLGDVLRFGSNTSGEEFDDGVAKEMLLTLLRSPGRRKAGTDSSGRKFPQALSQEHAYWKQVTPRSRHADQIEDLLGNLNRELEGMDMLSFDEAIDRLDQSKIMLLQFEIVLETYEKDRLINLFDIIADLFYEFIKSHHSRLQVWEETYASRSDRPHTPFPASAGPFLTHAPGIRSLCDMK